MRRQNGISIEDVMKMECMKKCRLIAGFGGIRNTVSKVNIMADPDVLEWVEAGELLLTTAYSFKQDDIGEQKQLVKKSAEMGLAGLGIKIQPYLKELHPEIIQMANVLNFPIIELHDAIPFSEIMTPIFQEIFNKQASLLKRIEKIHEQLMHVMLSGGDLKAIIGIVTDNVRNPVVVKLESHDEWLAEWATATPEMQEALTENARQFLKQAEQRGDRNRFSENMVTLMQQRIRRMVMPIVVKNRVTGYLMTWAVGTPLGGFDLSVLESASTTIALEVLKQLSVMDVENRYRTEFFEDLISMDDTRKKKAVEKASLFHLNPTDHYLVVVIKIDRAPEGLTDEVFQKMSWITQETDAYLRDTQLHALVISKTDSLNVIFTSADKKLLNEHVATYSRQLLARKPKKLMDIGFRVGIGRCYQQLEQVDKSYTDAVKAIQHGPLIGETEVVYFEQLGIYKILCHPSLKEELERFYQAVLMPLVRYDEKKSTELVKTLEVYYQQGGNLRKTAEVLFTHYNTTLYRMESIQRITGMDLNHHKDRLNLEVALKVKKLLE
ncbi:PucR family transcriptional regulator [Anoxynatronum buryatiense]|uniref:Purine catabolism regulatory protein n=1 Tax=Anoxynatronum buryatiense TaxID=489973 RepID=A0AA46AI00_9CLOT|nr:PucR family transcriptional regulator [Anoxynatronum buryatiense]SMP44265.1 purine catabolism regulatory protein [Anoxynatronum buryatiense]